MTFLICIQKIECGTFPSFGGILRRSRRFASTLFCAKLKNMQFHYSNTGARSKLSVPLESQYPQVGMTVVGWVLMSRLVRVHFLFFFPSSSVIKSEECQVVQIWNRSEFFRGNIRNLELTNADLILGLRYWRFYTQS